MRIKLLPGVYTAAVGLAATGALVIWPSQTMIGYSLFGVAGVLLLWGTRRTDGRHIWTGLFAWAERNVWWRLGRNPPASISATNKPPKRSDLELAAAHAITEFQNLSKIAPTQAVKNEFPYAYPKAVLKADILKPKGTQEAQTGQSAHKMTIVISIRNDHTAILTGCFVELLGFATGDGWTKVEEPMKAGIFHVSPQAPKNFPLLSRDIRDSITPQPFLLRLESRDIPLKDETSYILVLALRCRYPLPTIVTVNLVTGVGLLAEANITDQRIAESG